MSNWIKVYEEEGLDALCQFNYGTNKSELENHSVSLIKSFMEPPTMSACEARSRIEELTGVNRSPSQVRAFMKRHKMRYIKTGHIPAKADAEKQQAWVKTTLEPAIKEAKEEKCHLLFIDAAHFILEPFICALWCVTPLFIRASAGRNRINVLGVVNAITKEVITFNNTTYINAQTIVAF
ncbi:MAG: winged helix-turn-helix domain-containing protein [Bacteroidetes bacterium]|nr:winged helix-turn-helix domain-containing protein [Bacteroidota bacterium]